MAQPMNESTIPDNNPQHASFILRCWTGAHGQARGRLIDVRSGRDYPMANLADLPELVQRLLEPDLPMEVGLSNSPKEED